jgi:hypothetical protein
LAIGFVGSGSGRYERRGRLNQSDLLGASDCGGENYDLSSGG